MKLLNPTSAVFPLFGLKTLIQLKYFIYYRKRFSELCFFKFKILIQILYLKNPKFLSVFINYFSKLHFYQQIFKRSTKTVVSSCFQFSFQLGSHNMRRTNLRYFQIPFCQTITYCRYSMIINATYFWNNFVWTIQDSKKNIPPLLWLLSEKVMKNISFNV